MELKSCPFCSPEKMHRIGWHKQYNHEIEKEGELFQPFCRHCGCSLRGKKTKDEAIIAWNTRRNDTQ